MATAQAIREQEKTVSVSLLRETIFTFRENSPQKYFVTVTGRDWNLLLIQNGGWLASKRKKLKSLLFIFLYLWLKNIFLFYF